jgi:hypothetical protein
MYSILSPRSDTNVPKIQIVGTVSQYYKSHLNYLTEECIFSRDGYIFLEVSQR